MGLSPTSLSANYEYCLPLDNCAVAEELESEPASPLTHSYNRKPDANRFTAKMRQKTRDETCILTHEAFMAVVFDGQPVL